MKYVWVLLADGDGTMRSVDEPWGVAVSTEEEAKRYAGKGGVGYTHSYARLAVYDDYEQGRHDVYCRGRFPKNTEGCRYCEESPI